MEHVYNTFVTDSQARKLAHDEYGTTTPTEIEEIRSVIKFYMQQEDVRKFRGEITSQNKNIFISKREYDKLSKEGFGEAFICDIFGTFWKLNYVCAKGKTNYYYISYIEPYKIEGVKKLKPKKAFVCDKVVSVKDVYSYCREEYNTTKPTDEQLSWAIVNLIDKIPTDEVTRRELPIISQFHSSINGIRVFFAPREGYFYGLSPEYTTEDLVEETTLVKDYNKAAFLDFIRVNNLLDDSEDVKHNGDFERAAKIFNKTYQGEYSQEDEFVAERESELIARYIDEHRDEILHKIARDIYHHRDEKYYSIGEHIFERFEIEDY